MALLKGGIILSSLGRDLSARLKQKASKKARSSVRHSSGFGTLSLTTVWPLCSELTVTYKGNRTLERKTAKTSNSVPVQGVLASRF